MIGGELGGEPVAGREKDFGPKALQQRPPARRLATPSAKN
jgi:hypothetical protein